MNENYSYGEDPEIVEMANSFLKEHPEMLLRLSDEGDSVASWPFETLRYLTENYKSKDRKERTLSVVGR